MKKCCDNKNIVKRIVVNPMYSFENGGYKMLIVLKCSSCGYLSVFGHGFERPNQRDLM